MQNMQISELSPVIYKGPGIVDNVRLSMTSSEMNSISSDFSSY